VESKRRWLNNKSFFLPEADFALVALLNSKVHWGELRAKARIKSGGYIEAEAQYVEKLPIPSIPPALRAEIKRAFRSEIPVKHRGEWEAYLGENAARVKTLAAEIAAAEREIDVIVYELFDLTADEIALLESSLEGQY
jgi:hypothetical protein